jgi:hypothetical protein
MRLEFERNNFAVPTQTSLVEVAVRIDGDAGQAGAQPVPNGLFSYGVRLRFDPALVRPLDHEPVSAEPALNFFGFSAGALISEGSGFVAIKGNVNPSVSPYFGTRLAIFRLLVIGAPASTATLTLDVFSQSPSESVFIDGQGTQIDSQILPQAGTFSLLPPLRITLERGAGPSQVRLSFGSSPISDFHLQRNSTLTAPDWTTLAGAPHNSGEVVDLIVAREQFYRLLVVPRP